MEEQKRYQVEDLSWTKNPRFAVLDSLEKEYIAEYSIQRYGSDAKRLSEQKAKYNNETAS